MGRMEWPRRAHKAREPQVGNPASGHGDKFMSAIAVTIKAYLLKRPYNLS